MAISIRVSILWRVYVAFGLIVLVAIAILSKLFYIQIVQGDKWKAMADSLSTKYVKVEAVRGNIYSSDGSLLATSVPEYELHMDMLAGGIEKDQVFYEKVDSLAYCMSRLFKDKTEREFASLLRRGRKQGSRYLLIRRNVSHQDLAQIKKFPIFNMGRYKGGLIPVQQNKRIKPFDDLAARTIGYRNDNVQPVGLEGAYGVYMNGESGRRLMQRIAGGVWMPVNKDIEIAPQDGSDIISTIDVNMQDVAQNALLNQLIKSNAHHGCVIVMEVKTGEVRAIANYTKVSDGAYKETFNYAIAGNQDPGSTFKVASYMALLEDKMVDTADIVQTGTYKIPGHIIRDSHEGLGPVTVKRAFEESSNAAIAKMVDTHYRDNQARFTDHLYDWHLNEKLGLQIPGEARPVVKNPKSKTWSKQSLPQMAYGYEMQLTPLKMLSFYNAIANDGKYLAPIFVKEIRRLGQSEKTFTARVINEKICSDKTLSKMRKLLEGVVEEGTGKGIVYNPLYKVAGKTGTAQVADANRGYRARRQYQASFCGYFPADNPKYSMIVVVNDPKNGYYAAQVAGPPFREIADKIYAGDRDMFGAVERIVKRDTPAPTYKMGSVESVSKVFDLLGQRSGRVLKDTGAGSNIVADNGKVVRDPRTDKGQVPDLTGMGLKDAVFLLGNVGMRPIVRGFGKVITQSIPPGSRIVKGGSVLIELK